mgnify:CR=1 FL=1
MNRASDREGGSVEDALAARAKKQWRDGLKKVVREGRAMMFLICHCWVFSRRFKMVG